jgi:hypothetical protein
VVEPPRFLQHAKTAWLIGRRVLTISDWKQNSGFFIFNRPHPTTFNPYPKYGGVKFPAPPIP